MPAPDWLRGEVTPYTTLQYNRNVKRKKVLTVAFYMQYHVGFFSPLFLVRSETSYLTSTFSRVPGLS